ncbi:putative transcriptional regulatory protein pdtaR [Kordia sp. SMS9]|uniref:LytR/AlgR family response regulator transcription factor n=1 Tax=Kordia sp. SMS9 TaxID=2282170 RepID=UPI000E0D464D|nr:response regulator transcription factor [Kordia sp. SMS9]AXG69828.1 putative transcriptional regulatory protein pdtaR [Kordia sp. SMS9]
MRTINVFLVKEKDEKVTILKKLLDSHSYHVIGIANSYQEALLLYPRFLVDIIITDIMLNGKPDGIAFIENLLFSKEKLCPFIYLTGFENRHLYQRAKLTKPFAILHKPFNEIAMLYTLENVIEKLQTRTDDHLKSYLTSKIDEHSFFIKKKNTLHKVLLKNIIYIEVENRYCNIVTQKEKFVVLISLGKIKEFLDASVFLQIHRKYIINSSAIEQIIPKDNLIILKGNHSVTLGVKYKTILRQLVIIK